SQIVVALLIVGASAQWTDWIETPDSVCPDICGYCGVRVIATRTCNGTCSGPSRRYEECGAALCVFPRKTCCPGYAKGILPSKEFECVVIPA
ncbi:hypothetical protein PFISCL1PPCAC_1076, partial [Pristionchus fissidentatus]